jgi:indolepyruvate ferredoxin oxidoreductase
LARYQHELTAYQNKELADRFTARVLPLRELFEAQQQGHLWTRLCSTYFRLLAYKDEFEVARLHIDSEWAGSTLAQFEPKAKLYFHFAPSWLAGHSTRPRKIKLGPWIRPVLKLLAGSRGLRGTWLDPFKGSVERKNQTQLVSWFESWVDLMHNNPSLLRYSKRVGHTLDLFNQVKGFGRVRVESFDKVRLEIQNQYDQDRQQT